MKKENQLKYCFLTGIILLIFVSGCAAPGQKFIHINYTKMNDSALKEQNQGEKIGVSLFQDLRENTEKGYIGYRELNDKSRETYMATGLDLGISLQKTFLNYIGNKGYEAVSIDPWEASFDGMHKAPEGFKLLVAGEINQFECRARKKGFLTTMTLDINITTYIADISGRQLKTNPVKFQLERTDVNFSQHKLEQFVNDAIEEIIINARIL